MSNMPRFTLKDSPFSDDETDNIVTDIMRGGERLIQQVSVDINRITILRAMQMGYLKACQDLEIILLI